MGGEPPANSQQGILPTTIYMSLEVDPSTVQLWDDCQPLLTTGL